MLRRLGQELAASFRDADVVGRYGGEEFMVVMPATGLAGATQAAQALRQRVAAMRFAELPRPVTVSCGVAAFQPGRGNVAEWVKAADAALYLAKNRGRNRVEVATA